MSGRAEWSWHQKNEEIRLAFDYRHINKKTKKDLYPLPKISNIIDKVRNSEYFSSLDATSAYHQIPLVKENIPITAFC